MFRNPQAGDDLRVLVGRQHAGLAVYMRGTITGLTDLALEVRLHATGSQIRTLGLVDIPDAVTVAIRKEPSAPRVLLGWTPEALPGEPAPWRLPDDLPRREQERASLSRRFRIGTS